MKVSQKGPPMQRTTRETAVPSPRSRRVAAPVVSNADTEIGYGMGESSLGLILVARSNRGVCAILLGDKPDELIAEVRRRFPRADIQREDGELQPVVGKVVGFVEEPCAGLDLPLDIRGTAFQQRVWNALLTIPVGETASYQQIAEQIGAPTAMRAVAQACGANSIAVAIPCHRVVRTDGGISGYRWGVERKRALLERERNGLGQTTTT